MAIYIGLILLILILPKLKINKKMYCILIGFAMLGLVSARDISMGMSDTEFIYLPIFNKLAQSSIVESYRYIERNDLEVVFYMLTKLFTLVSNNYRIYLIILAIPFNFFVSRFIYKYSKIPSLSFILFCSLNYFGMEFTLLRHCIAISFVIWSYDYIVKKDLKKFIICVLLATLFHKTAIIFLLAYPLSKVETGYKNFFAIVVSLVVSVTFGKRLLQIIITFINSRRYLNYLNPEADSLTFFFMNLLILLFIYMFIRKYSKEPEYKALMNIYTIGICISSCTIFIGEAFRLSTFFTIFSIIILPNAIYLLSNIKNKTCMILCFNVFLIMYFFLFTLDNLEINPYIFGL